MSGLRTSAGLGSFSKHYKKSCSLEFVSIQSLFLITQKMQREMRKDGSELNHRWVAVLYLNLGVGAMELSSVCGCGCYAQVIRSHSGFLLAFVFLWPKAPCFDLPTHSPFFVVLQIQVQA